MILQGLFYLIISIIIAFVLTEVTLVVMDIVSLGIVKMLSRHSSMRYQLQSDKGSSGSPNQQTKPRESGIYIPKYAQYFINFIIRRNNLPHLPLRNYTKKNLLEKNCLNFIIKPFRKLTGQKLMNSAYHQDTLPQDKEG